MKKNIILLGASGSIGKQTLNVIRRHSNLYTLKKISIGYNVVALEEILNEFTDIEEVALLDKAKLIYLKEKYPQIKFYLGDEGILDLINNDYDILLNAIVGFAGLMPSIKVIKQDKVLALANKETMVIAGEIINDLLIKHPQAQILPVDSEHCAIFQCLHGNNKNEVKRLLISASGGSFRDKTLEELTNVSVKDALNHPNWDMGASITIDSATMFNKGLEVIEAHYLFNVSYDDIKVLIHRESIVHSMVEYVDGSVIAQLSKPNMEQPIIYALGYPERLSDNVGNLDFDQLINLSFEPIDTKRFYALELAYQAGRLGHSYPCVLNASKEVATQAFLDEKIKFLDIVSLVEKALEHHQMINNPTIEDLIKVDAQTRSYAQELIKEFINGNT